MSGARPYCQNCGRRITSPPRSVDGGGRPTRCEHCAYE